MSAFSVVLWAVPPASAAPACGGVYADDLQRPLEFDNPARPLPPSSSPLFQSSTVLNMKLTGEFERIRQANLGGNWTGEDRTDPKYWTTLTLTLQDPSHPLLGRARSRGMSSATETEGQFPKLRVELDESQKLAGTVFKGARHFRMNTHVSTHPTSEWTGMGRLNDERSPYREALGYEMAQALGLPTPLIRRARVEYTDISVPGVPQSFTRNALLIETDKKIAERYGAVVDADFPASNQGMSVLLAARFHLFNALIGNDDIGLKLKNEPSIGTEKYRPLFNTTVFKRPNGELFPIVYDLDLSTVVSGEGALEFDRMKLPDFEADDGRVARPLARLALLRSRLSRSEFLQALSDVLSRENLMREAVRKAAVDEEGRQTAYRLIDNFKRAAALVMQFPMLMTKDARFFADPQLSREALQPKFDGPGTLRPGTLIRVLEPIGDVVKIAIIDSRFDLVSGAGNVGYIRKSDLVLGDDLPPELQGQTDERDMVYN